METNDFNDRKYTTSQEAFFAKENLKLRKRIKNERIFFGLVIVVLILILISQCTEIDHQRKNIRFKVEDYGRLEVKKKELEKKLANQKPVLDVKDTIIGNKHQRLVSAIISNVYDKRPSFLLIPDIIVREKFEVKIPVPVPDSSAIVMLEDCAKANEYFVDELARIESLLDDTIKVCIDKQYPDSNVVKKDTSYQVRSFLSNNPPSFNYNDTYTEYLPNPYREKAQKNFWWGLGLGTGAALTYIASEAIGNPKFYDDRDNKEAQTKSNTILGLRIGTGALAAASLLEFGRAIHFHKLEGKFIVSPTTFGAVIYLDRK